MTFYLDEKKIQVERKEGEEEEEGENQEYEGPAGTAGPKNIFAQFIYPK